MENIKNQFSVEITGEKPCFFTNEFDAERWANGVIANSLQHENETKNVTITNLDGIANYSHKYWNYSAKKWVKVLSLDNKKDEINR